MRITRSNNDAIKYACLHFHYAKSIPVNTIGYNIYNKNNEWCGVILYGTGANPHIGYEYNLPQGTVLELVRVALNGKQECTSMAVAMTLKQLKKDCPLCRLVVSYADCDQKHLGIIYQATNWVYVGKKGEGTRSAFIIHGKKRHLKSVHSWKVIIDGKKTHCPENIDAIRKYIDPTAEIFKTKGKLKYLMPMDKKIRKQILPFAKPYPKNEDWEKIDRKKFKQNEESREDEKWGKD